MTPSAIRRLNIIQAVPGRPLHMAICLMTTDIFTLLVSVEISLVCRMVLSGSLHLGGYVRLWPFLFVFIAVYAAAGLYSGVARSPPEELRRVTLSSVLVFVLLAAVTVSLRGATNPFTWTLFLAIVLSVALLPLFRAIVRLAFAQESWWGCPAVIF